MSSIILNSESKLSQCISNHDSESDIISEEGLFSSLFVLISKKNEDNFGLEKHSTLSEEIQTYENLNFDNKEIHNTHLLTLDKKKFLNGFKKNPFLKNGKHDFFSKQKLTLKENSMGLNLEMLNTRSKEEFSKNFSEILKNINNNNVVKSVNLSSFKQNPPNKQLIDLVSKKNQTTTINNKDNPDDFEYFKFKIKEFKTDFSNGLTVKVKEETSLNNTKKELFDTLDSTLNINKSIKLTNDKSISKIDINSFSNNSNSTINTNISNQYLGNNSNGSSFNGGNSFYSGSGNSLEYLNMLDKSWSNSLLNKIEKGIKNGEETLEISLKPNNLGKLKVSLSLNNESARINITTENPSAALLLSEAESKLSQMLENTGLKLLNLSTNSDQGRRNNTKNGNQDNTEKKMLANDEISLEKGDKTVSKINSKNQILNLLA